MADEKEYYDGNNTYHTNDKTYIDFSNRKKTDWDKRWFPKHVLNNLAYTTGSVQIQTVENGRVTASPMSGKVGAEVTITAEPNEGYVLATLTANSIDVMSTKKFNLIGGTNNIVATFTLAGD